MKKSHIQRIIANESFVIYYMDISFFWASLDDILKKMSYLCGRIEEMHAHAVAIGRQEGSRCESCTVPLL